MRPSTHSVTRVRDRSTGSPPSGAKLPTSSRSVAPPCASPIAADEAAPLDEDVLPEAGCGRVVGEQGRLGDVVHDVGGGAHGGVTGGGPVEQLHRAHEVARVDAGDARREVEGPVRAIERRGDERHLDGADRDALAVPLRGEAAVDGGHGLPLVAAEEEAVAGHLDLVVHEDHRAGGDLRHRRRELLAQRQGQRDRVTLVDRPVDRRVHLDHGGTLEVPLAAEGVEEGGVHRDLEAVEVGEGGGDRKVDGRARVGAGQAQARGAPRLIDERAALDDQQRARHHRARVHRCERQPLEPDVLLVVVTAAAAAARSQENGQSDRVLHCASMEMS